MDVYGIDYLRRKLAMKRPRVLTRYNYYEMKNIVQDHGSMIPENMKWMHHSLGWCAKAVDSLADRLTFRGFRDDNFNLWNIYRLNNPDIIFDNAVLSALVSSCCFIHITADESGLPRLNVIDGGNATGIMDEVTGMLQEGYAVLARDDNGKPKLEAHFVPGSTTYYPAGGRPYRMRNSAPYPLLVPIVYRPDAARPFGHSQISRACMDIMQSAIRTIKRSEVSAEFYSFPQKYVVGLDPESDGLDKWKATMSSFLAFTKDSEGGSPHLGQFQQQSMSPYTEQLRTFAALFAGETGLTLDDLGFVTDNPSSAEAIKASHENLRLAAKKAQRTFGSGFLNAGYLAACVRDNVGYRRDQIYMTTPIWDPVFEPDAAMLSGIGDGVGKINQAVPGFFSADTLGDMIGGKREV